VKNAVLFLALAATAATASGLRVAGSDPGLCRPISDSGCQIEACRFGQEDREDTTAIAYDNGVHQSWWSSDRDSFGAAVRFTPAGYPCYVVGARAEVGWDTTSGSSQIYLRVYDDDGSGGLPGTILCEEHRTDVPRGNRLGFRDYDLTAPVVIDSGDFYVCFWQKHWFSLLFGTDTQLDSVQREWWFFPDQGWVTLVGMNAGDHLIRARVLYSTGVEDELPASQVPGMDEPGATMVRGVLKFEPANGEARTAEGELLDISGRKARDLRPGANDVRALTPGVYFMRSLFGGERQPPSVTKVIINR